MSDAKAPLAEEKQQAIRDLRSARASQQKTADLLDISRTTVKKYQPDDAPDGYPGWEAAEYDPNEIFSEGVDYERIVTDEHLPDEWRDNGGSGSKPPESNPEQPQPDDWTGPKPGDSPLADEASSRYRLTDDYADMTPGEFVKEFFEDFEVGVRTKFAEMIARRADRTKKLPDKDKMKSMLQQHSSGIGNANDAEFVAEEWWEEAQNYLAETEATAYGTTGNDNPEDMNQGSYVGAGGGQQQGEWLQIPGQGMQYGKMERQPDGSVRFVPMQPPNQQPQTRSPNQPMMFAGQNQQPDPRLDKIEEKLNDFAEKMDGGENDSENMGEAKSKFQDLMEIKEVIEAFEGDDGQSDEAIRTLQQQLQQMQRQIADEAQQTPASSPKDQAIMKVMQDDNVSADKALDIIERMEGTSDPEVEKARIESETELKKMEQKKERAERLIDGLDDVFTRIGQGIGQGISGGGGNGQRQPPRQNQNRQRATQEQNPNREANGHSEPDPNQSQPDAVQDMTAGMDMGADEWECPECGAVTEQDPRIPGVECGECDYTRMQCPECHGPIEIPPEEQRSMRACPNCNGAVDEDNAVDGQVACMECDWAGSELELGPEVAECDGCGTVHQLVEAPVE